MLSKRLKQAREDRNLSMTQLSKITNISIATISQTEKGVCNISSNNLISLCKALEVSSDYLLGIDDVITINEKYNVQNALKLMQEAVALLNNNKGEK